MKYSLLVRFNCSLFGVNSIYLNSISSARYTSNFLFISLFDLSFLCSTLHSFIYRPSFPPPSPPPPLPNIIWYQAEFKETWRGAGGYLINQYPIQGGRAASFFFVLNAVETVNCSDVVSRFTRMQDYLIHLLCFASFKVVLLILV